MEVIGGRHRSQSNAAQPHGPVAVADNSKERRARVFISAASSSAGPDSFMQRQTHSHAAMNMGLGHEAAVSESRGSHDHHNLFTGLDHTKSVVQGHAAGQSTLRSGASRPQSGHRPKSSSTSKGVTEGRASVTEGRASVTAPGASRNVEAGSDLALPPTLGMHLVKSAYHLQGEVGEMYERSEARTAFLQSVRDNQRDARARMAIVEEIARTVQEEVRQRATAAAAAAAAAQRPWTPQHDPRGSYADRHPHSDVIVDEALRLSALSPPLPREVAAPFRPPPLGAAAAAEAAADTGSSGRMFSRLMALQRQQQQPGASGGANRSDAVAAAAAAASSVAGGRQLLSPSALGLPSQAGSLSLSAGELDRLAGIALERWTVQVCNKAAEPCCICLETMVLGEGVRMLPCAHRMHGPCLQGWLRGKSVCVCPLCKRIAS